MDMADVVVDKCDTAGAAVFSTRQTTAGHVAEMRGSVLGFGFVVLPTRQVSVMVTQPKQAKQSAKEACTTADGVVAAVAVIVAVVAVVAVVPPAAPQTARL